MLTKWQAINEKEKCKMANHECIKRNVTLKESVTFISLNQGRHSHEKNPHEKLKEIIVE